MAITEQQLEELYLNQNLTIEDVKNILHISKNQVKRLLKQYGIIKSRELKRERVKQTSLEKYGTEHPTQNSKVKEKFKNTCIERYGVEHSSSAESVKEKTKQTIVQKYGVEHYTQLQKIKDKHIQTETEKYGKLYSQTQEYKNRVKQTSMNKFGKEYYAQTSEYRDRVKQTCLEKYGTDSFSKTEEFKDKFKQTCINRYGTDSFSKTEEFRNIMREKHDEIQKKTYTTKKRNNTFHTSKPEDEAYELLAEHFSKGDIIRQYRSETYPYPCDFYISSLDLYIEYNGSWTHGSCPYDSSNSIHKKILEKWQKGKDAGSKFYMRAIDTWTNRDPEKRKIAKENNLNWLEFFTIEELQGWLSSDP